MDQISTNTFSYTMCSAPNVHMFVYTLIIAPIVPLSNDIGRQFFNNLLSLFHFGINIKGTILVLINM